MTSMEIHGMGELILSIREERGIRQEVLCDGLCTQKQLSKIEMGKMSAGQLFAGHFDESVGKVCG